MMNFQRASFQYTPFPFGLVDGILPPDLYSDMVHQFPPSTCFMDVSSPDNGIKYLLKEPQLSATVRRLGSRATAWSHFLRVVYAATFVEALDAFLTAHHVELRLAKLSEYLAPALPRLGQSHGRVPRIGVEISRIPSGGYQKPHTDVITKILTILIPMNEEGVWREGDGGRVLFCRPRNDRNSFNLYGRYAEFSEMETVRACALEPNQGILFPKTHNSWHAVEPVVIPPGSPHVRQMLSIIVYLF
jgi:hypothetical protein